VLLRRVLVSSLAVAAAALAAAIAIGVITVPNVADAIADATDPLGAWIYLAVMALVFVETTVMLGFLIHGELALMLGGVAAERGDASLIAMTAAACAAAIAGDVASLLIGRRLGRPFLERHGARIGIAAPRLDRVDDFFQRHGGKALFVGRFNGFLRSTMPFAVGSAGVAVRRLLPYSAASAVIWTATFTAIGYLLAESFESAGATATRIGFALALVVGAVLMLRSVRRRAAR
jgi:membrane protein DedA with SNARE-associated domain